MYKQIDKIGNAEPTVRTIETHSVAVPAKTINTEAQLVTYSKVNVTGMHNT